MKKTETRLADRRAFLKRAGVAYTEHPMEIRQAMHESVPA